MEKRFIPYFFLLLCTGCCAHPRFTEPTACSPCTTWQPPYKPLIEALCPTLPQKEKLTAVELIDIALKNNPETKAAWEAARAAAYQLQAAKKTLYPRVDAEGGYALSYQNFSGSNKGSESGLVVVAVPEDQDALIDPSTGIAFGEFVGGNKDFSQLITSDLAASYLLFDFGARSALIESARQALQIANWQHNRLIQEVIIRVLNAYYAYLNFKALLEAQEDDLKDAEMNHNAAKHLFEAGCKNHLDVLQSQSLLVNIQLIMEETKGFVSIELGNLANALGLPANTPLNVASLPEQLPQDKVECVEKLMETAKQRRPDLAAYLAAYNKKRADLAFAEADGLPFFTANGDIERVDGLTKGIASGTVYSAALSLEIPLFQGYYFANRKRAAKAKVREAFAALQTKESDVLLDVWKSYYAFKTAVKTYKYSEEFLKFTEETYEAALGGYKEGTSSILDLLSAQKALSRARAHKIQARTEWFTSLAGIAYATGTI